MLENLPLYITVAFGITTFLTLFLFWNAMKNSGIKSANKIVYGILFWMIIQAFLGLKGVYHQNLDTIPPKILLFGILPILLIMIFILTSKTGRNFVNQLEIKYLALINTIRIPVEIILFGLFLHKTIPIEMTFEGRNFDILAGISAVFVYYFGFVKQKLSRKTLLIWNFLSLALLINIIVLAFICAPSPFQKLGFNQPNIAILYFPFVWLPTVIVPIVLFGHLVVIKKLVVDN